MRARPDGPGVGVERTPQAEPLAAAAGGEVAGEPLRELLIVDEDRIAKVGAVTGRQRRRVEPGKRRAAVARYRHAREIARGRARVVVVDDDGVAVAAPHRALALGDVRVDFAPGDRLDIAGRWRRRLPLGRAGAGRPGLLQPAADANGGGAQVRLPVDAERVNIRAGN